MVALIRPNNLSNTESKPASGHLWLAVDNENPGLRPNDRSSRRSTVGANADNLPLMRGLPVYADGAQIVAVAAAMAFVVFGFLLGIRLVQGAPDPSMSLLEPSLSQQQFSQQQFSEQQFSQQQFSEQQGPARPVGHIDSQIVVAETGDSMWSIAVDLGATENPETTVQALIEANGGSSIVVGQQIIVPEQLVG